jgi:hypothetical protein
MTIEELEAKIKAQDEALKIEKAKVVEFRDNNIALTQNVEALNAKFKGIDIDEYSKMQKEAQELKDKKMISAGKVDELVEEKVNKIRTEQVAEMKKIQETNVTLSTQLNAQVVGSAVKTAAIKAGIVGTAIDDVLTRSNSMWTVKDGKPVAVNKDGAVIWVEGTTEPLTLDKWVESLKETAPHLFGDSKGTGAENPKYDPSTKTMNRQTFDAASQKDRAAFFKDGGKVVD